MSNTNAQRANQALDLIGNQYGGGNPNTVNNNPIANNRTDLMYAQGAPTAPAVTPAAVAPTYTPQQFSITTPADSAIVKQSLDNMNQVYGGILDPNSAIMKDAKQRGLEMASQRGNINSSIAVGAAERQVLGAAGGIASQVYGDANNSRDFYRAAKLLPLQHALSFSTDFATMASENPEVYTPEYVNGMTNFFMSNMQNVMQNFFGDTLQGGL
jgi:hypothetical protein